MMSFIVDCMYFYTNYIIDTSVQIRVNDVFYCFMYLLHYIIDTSVQIQDQSSFPQFKSLRYCSSAISLATLTSRCLLPAKGPTMPAFSSWSMMRPALL